MNKVKNGNQQPLDTNDQIPDELDTETTFADMTVEGMPWHKAKNSGGGQSAELPQLSKKEQWALIRGALLAALPMIGVLVLTLGLVYCLAYLWLS